MADTMTVEEVLNGLRRQPRYWRVVIGMCDAKSGHCNRGDVCEVSWHKEDEIVDYAFIHGPQLLHFGKQESRPMIAEEVINRLNEFPKRRPVIIGMCDGNIGQCFQEHVHQVSRHVAGKLIEQVLIHGPLILHK